MITTEREMIVNIQKIIIKLEAEIQVQRMIGR